MRLRELLRELSLLSWLQKEKVSKKFKQIDSIQDSSKYASIEYSSPFSNLYSLKPVTHSIPWQTLNGL